MSKASSIRSESIVASPVLASAEHRIGCQLDACRVRVLLFPLTEIPEKRLRFYSKVITECHSEIHTSNSILRNGNESSQLNLSFYSEIDAVADDFIDFQLHFRTFAVIGLVSASELSAGIEPLLVKYNAVLERFPYPVCARIFVIDCEERISSLTAPFVSIPMNDIVGTLEVQFACIGSEIVTGMLNLLDSLSSRPALPSPCGIEDFSGTASRPSTRTKMKVSSRLQKLTADLHVLAGKFSEAVACYAIAAEDAKSANDLIWQTAALEGFQIAVCLQNESLSNIIDPISYKALVEKLLPLAVQYEKSGVPMLSVQLQLNCAKVLLSVSLSQQALTVLADAWKTSCLLGLEDRLIAFRRVLHQIGEADFPRKWAFYASQLALNLKIAHEFDAAIETFSHALEEYSNHSGWDSITSTIFKELLRMSENSSNRLLYFIFAWKCLSMCSYQLDSEEQIRLLDSLRKRSKSDVFCLSNGAKELSDLPIFISLQLSQANIGLYRTADSSGEADSAAASPYGPFIYAPNQDIAKKLIPSDSLICDSASEFKVTLRNPFVFPIQLRNVRLIVENESEAECDSIAMLLPPQCENYTASLSCKPFNCGSIRVLGLSLTFMSVQINYFTEALELEVISSQPLLQFLGFEFDKHIHLYEGEQLKLDLPFEKKCDDEFRSLSITFSVQEKDSSVEERIESLIFDEPLSSAVQAEAEIQDFNGSLPIAIQGHSQLHAFTANVLYSGGGQFWRRLKVPFHCHLQPVVRVVECHFFPGKDKQTCTLSLLVENCIEEAVSLRINGKEQYSLSSRESLRFFLPIPRLCLDEIDLESKLPLNEKQVALIRKLKHSDNANFLDHEYEEELYDPIKYWTKRHLMESVSLTWSIPSSNRTGKGSLAQVPINTNQTDIVTYRTPLLSPNAHQFTARLGEPVPITFTSKEFQGTVQFKLVPLVDLGNGLLAVNFEDVLLLSGPIESIISARESRTFTFFPISTANFVIRYEVTHDGKNVPSNDSISIRTIN